MPGLCAETTVDDQVCATLCRAQSPTNKGGGGRINVALNAAFGISLVGDIVKTNTSIPGARRDVKLHATTESLVHD